MVNHEQYPCALLPAQHHPEEEELCSPCKATEPFLMGGTRVPSCLRSLVWSGLASMEGGKGDKGRLQSGRSLGKEQGVKGERICKHNRDTKQQMNTKP